MSTDTSWYWAALTSSDSVPADVHRRAWVAAAARSDTDAQAVLVRRLDAPADLVETYAACTDVSLRNAYLSRADVAEAAEYTGKVTGAGLAEALLSSNWADPVYDAALEHFAGRATKVLADALVRTPARLRHGALAKALFRFADTQRSDKAPHQWAEQLEPYAGHLSPTQAADLLGDLGSPRIVALLLRLDVDVDVALAACRRVGAPLARFVATNTLGARHGASALLAIFRASAHNGGRDPDAVDAALADTLSDTHSRYALGIAAAALPPWQRQGPLSWKDSAERVQHRDPVAEIASASARRLAEWATSSRVEHLAEVVCRVEHLVAEAVEAHVWGRTPGVVPAAAAAALWENVHAPVSLRHRVAHAWLTLPDPLRGTMQVDALSTWPGDDVLRDAWCTLWPASVLSEHGWAPFEASAPREEWLIRWAPTGDDDAGAEKPLRAAAASLTGAELRHLPWPVLCSIRHNAGTRAAVKVVAEVTEAFASVPAAWRVFEQLSGDFDGSFGDLIDVCLAATE